MTTATGRPRFQFGLSELGVSVALFAATLGFGKLVYWMANHPYLDNPLFALCEMLAGVCGISCLFGSIGELFQRGLRFAVLGAEMGAALVTPGLIIVLVYFCRVLFTFWID